jgi:hypothetical protein
VLTTLEQDIVQKFQKLDQDAQKRVHAQLSELMQDKLPKKFDYQAWAEKIDACRVTANTTNATVLELLDEVRETRSDDLCRS